MSLNEKMYPVPTNLSECFMALDNIFSESAEEATWFKSTEEEEAVSAFHMGFGQDIRNKWGLWTRDTELYKVFSNMGLWHADDMSSVILTSYHRKINGRELALKEQVQYFMDYWKDYEKTNGPVEKN